MKAIYLHKYLPPPQSVNFNFGVVKMAVISVPFNFFFLSVKMNAAYQKSLETTSTFCLPRPTSECGALGPQWKGRSVVVAILAML